MGDVESPPEKTSCRVGLKTVTSPRDFSEITTTLERKKKMLAIHLHPFIHFVLWEKVFTLEAKAQTCLSPSARRSTSIAFRETSSLPGYRSNLEEMRKHQ